MTEKIQTTPELDFDQWLATGERTTHLVPLYARFDILADIEALEAKIPEEYKNPPQADPEESLGGSVWVDPFADLREQIDALYLKINESRLTFRVTALTQSEIDAIREEVETELSEEIDAAARRGQTKAKRDAKRTGTTNANELNVLIRNGAKTEAENLIRHECSLRMVAAATSKQDANGLWSSVTLEQVRQINDRLGDAQLDLLASAAVRATREVPEVTVPKS